MPPSLYPCGQKLTGEATCPISASHLPTKPPELSVVGARTPLVACNVNLDTPDVKYRSSHCPQNSAGARHKSDTYRSAGIRACFSKHRNVAQVSLNVTQPDKTSIAFRCFRWIRNEANTLGADAVESEIIGAIPRFSLGGEPPEAILWKRYNPHQILETWLEWDTRPA